jgi:hypothetical protein
MMNNYLISSPFCRDIWKVNEITNSSDSIACFRGSLSYCYKAIIIVLFKPAPPQKKMLREPTV